jgi:ABC-2 type transport system permease protein
MRAFIGLLKKELIQLRRDPIMLRLIFVMPIIQLLVLGYAINVDVKRISMDVYDLDRSQGSRELISAMRAGDYFEPDESNMIDEHAPLWELKERFQSGRSDIALIIPDQFDADFTRDSSSTVALLVDGADANQARIGLGYASQIINEYSRRRLNTDLPIKLRHKALYNPEAESIYFMVPGIVATLLTMVTMMLTAMAIVRERELGTLEQLMVTPITGFTLLMGKITTFAILGFVEIVVALTIGILWFNVPFVGSPVLLFALSALYLLTTLGLGMFFSTVTSTQQQAMFLTWFFSIFAILTSGFFTPISNMPDFMQYVTLINPMRYFMAIVRGILLKGATATELTGQIYPLIIFGIGIFLISLARFRKRLD